MTMFSDALSFAFGAIEDTGGVQADYNHTGVIKPLTMVPGRKESQDDVAGQTTTSNREADWMVRTTDYDAAFSDKPKRGNTITLKDDSGSVTRVYKLAGANNARFGNSPTTKAKLTTDSRQ